MGLGQTQQSQMGLGQSRQNQMGLGQSVNFYFEIVSKHCKKLWLNLIYEPKDLKWNEGRK